MMTPTRRLSVLGLDTTAVCNYDTAEIDDLLCDYRLL